MSTCILLTLRPPANYVCPPCSQVLGVRCSGVVLLVYVYRVFVFNHLIQAWLYRGFAREPICLASSWRNSLKHPKSASRRERLLLKVELGRPRWSSTQAGPAGWTKAKHKRMLTRWRHGSLEFGEGTERYGLRLKVGYVLEQRVLDGLSLFMFIGCI